MGNKLQWCSVNGLLFKGKTGTAYESNEVFFPAAGFYHYGTFYDINNNGYWSSTPDGDSRAYYLYFGSDYKDVSYRSKAFDGSVRAVLAE